MKSNKWKWLGAGLTTTQFTPDRVSKKDAGPYLKIAVNGLQPTSAPAILTDALGKDESLAVETTLLQQVPLPAATCAQGFGQNSV